MAVTAFDGQFSFRQDSLARLGHTGGKGMNAAEAARFQNSPFMQSVRQTEALTSTFTTSRDEKRRKTDPSFRPSDKDFKAPKNHEYDKEVDYYKTLGVDEFAPLDDVKKAYKQLSLIYHPDKGHGLSKEQKEEHQGIFIELKNAYQTLSDNSTRRQYDRDRDRDKASFEVSGYKVRKKAHFDAVEVLKRLRELQKPPGRVIDVPVQVKLEKFFYGGHKGIKRGRIVQSNGCFGKMSSQEMRTYRVDIPQGAEEPHACCFKNQGDQHEDTLPDTLNFLIKSKPHETVRREGADLVLKEALDLGREAHLSPHIAAQTPTVRGRHLLLWGCNPFFKATTTGRASLNARIHGEGVGPAGCLRLTCRLGSEAPPAPPAPLAAPPAPSATPTPAAQASRRPSAAGSRRNSGAGPPPEAAGVVAVEHLDTGGRAFVRATADTTMGQLRSKLAEVLRLPPGSMVRMVQQLPGGFAPFSDRKALGDLRTLLCVGTVWEGPRLDADVSVAFLRELLKAAEAAEPASLSGIEHFLPDFGFEPTRQELKERIASALEHVRAVPVEAELCGRVEALFEDLSAAEERQAAVAATMEQPTADGRRTVEEENDAEAVIPEAQAEPEVEGALCGAGSAAEHGRGGICEAPAMLRRMERKAAAEPTCEVELRQCGETITLFTRPTSTVTFYSSTGQPCSLFAVVVASPQCAKKVAAGDWAQLKERLVPALQCTAFLLLREARASLPRSICARAAPPAALADGAAGLGAMQGERGEPRASCRDSPRVPWRRLGREAFGRGDYFTAMAHFSRDLQDLALAEGDAPQEEAVAFSNRAACLSKVGDHKAALEDARRARDLRPRWGRAWSRVGASAAALAEHVKGVESLMLLQEACNACFKAVEFEPSASTIEALVAIIAKAAGADPDAAHEEKENGSEALRANEVGLAVAHYTRGIASIPPRQGSGLNPAAEEHSMLRAVLHSNRAGALSRLRCWELAAADARQALTCREDFAKAHSRLGTALLGCGETEQAYAAFARALVLDPRGSTALSGRQACISMLPAWQSRSARRRVRERFGRDLCRPSGSSKVYCISDVHFDHRHNEDWAHSIDDFKFQEDVLIIAGNLCDSKNALVRALTTFKSKFRRVFYIPGNHEMWLHPSEAIKYPDSLAKLLSIIETCDELDVDVFPAAIAHDIFIVPLLSWYSAEFDEKDPFPGSEEVDKAAKWPLDPEAQLWKYMLKMNRAHFWHPYHGTVITCSHFLPRQDLPFESKGNAAKSMGCTELDNQIRSLNVRKHVHVYGHSSRSHRVCKDDVWYVNHYHGQEAGHSDKAPIFLVHDGKDVVNACVQVRDAAVRGR